MRAYKKIIGLNNMGLDAIKNCLGGVCKQQRRRLISAFVIRLSESNIHNLVTGEISIFLLVSV